MVRQQLHQCHYSKQIKKIINNYVILECNFPAPTHFNDRLLYTYTTTTTTAVLLCIRSNRNIYKRFACFNPASAKEIVSFHTANHLISLHLAFCLIFAFAFCCVLILLLYRFVAFAVEIVLQPTASLSVRRVFPHLLENEHLALILIISCMAYIVQ